MKTKWFFVVMSVLCSIATLHGQGTAFTYQGRLLDQGNPPSGRYAMEFSLWDSASAGTRVSALVTNGNVNVSNGLFTVTVDFGSAPFSGAARWLQIGVRTNGSVAPFGLLTSRQAVTPAPYAIMAGNLNGVLPDAQLSANIPRLNSNQTFSGNINLSGLGSIGIGTTSPVDAKLDVEGTVRMNDNDIYLRTGTDRNHGIGYRGTVSGRGIDGPFVYGFNGGALGASGPDSVSLSWTWTGDVWISNRLDTALINVRSNASFGGDVAIANTSDLNFGNNTRQMINLWSANYGIGVQNNTLYQRTDGGFAWFRLGSHTNNQNNAGAGGTNLMMLDFSGHLQVNAGITLDLPSANNGSYYPGLLFGAGSGESIASKRTSGGNQYGIDFYTGFNPRLSIANNGNVGINTTAPGGLLDINTGNGRMQFINDLVPGLNLTGGSIPGLMRLRNAIEVWPSMDGTRAGYLDLRATNGAATIQLNGASGEATVKVLTITGGADIAEPFQMSDEKIPKGAVVVIDEEKTGHLKMSSGAYDTRVAGIVSGANGINPGLSLHQQGLIEGGQNVALSGRVYALADARHGAIKPGDLLTTSDTPGHVMKVTDRERGAGAVLGKAMSGLKEGKGLVLVLVSLQ